MNVVAWRDSRWLDGATMLALAALGYAYLARWPRDLFMFDEGLLLYEAKRILAGEVPYRDFFEIITPGAIYVIAGAFALFGVSMETARAVNSTVHVLIMLLTFALCRRLGVGRALAAVVAVGHLALATLFLPITSVHWFGTLLTLAVLRAALSPRPDARPLWLGVWTGLLVVVQHQKGIVVGAGAVLILTADAVLWSPAYGRRRRAVMTDLARFAAGMLIVVGPLFGALLLSAGIAPMFDALVRFPLQNYHGRYNRSEWGGEFMPYRHARIPIAVVRWVPAIAAMAAVRVGLAARVLWRAERESTDTARREPRPPVSEGRTAFVLFVMSVFSTLSILYNPNAIHLALVAPIHLILAAECFTWLTGSFRAPRLASAIAWALALLLAFGLRRQLQWNRIAQFVRYPVRVSSALGPVNVETKEEGLLIAYLREHLPSEGRREVLGYPVYASIYLLVDAQNPTRFQVMLPGYSPPEHVAEAIEVIETRRVPFVAVHAAWVDWQHDPMLAYLDRLYERVPLGDIPAGYYPNVVLFKRKPGM